jgi:hypothetical protein
MKSWQLILSIAVVATLVGAGLMYVAKEMGLLSTAGGITYVNNEGNVVSGTNANTEICTGGITQSADLNVAGYGGSTAITEAHSRYRICGAGANFLGTWTMGTALTALAPGSCIEVLSGIDTTVAQEYDNTYGPILKIANLPCVISTVLQGFNDEVEGSMSLTFYNSDNNPTTLQTSFASDFVNTIKVVTASENEFYGNPYIGEPSYLGLDWNSIKNIGSGIQFLKGVDQGSHSTIYPDVFAIKYNSHEFSTPVYVKATLQDGTKVTMDSISCPQRVVTDATASNFTFACWEAPIASDSTYDLDVKWDPKISTGILQNATGYYYPGTFYANTYTGEISWGSEDNKQNVIGTDGGASITFIFKA